MQTVPGHQTPKQLRHHRRLSRFRFLGDQLPGLRIKHPPIPIGNPPTRPTGHRIGRHRPPGPRRDLRRLILPVHGIFQQRPAVSPIGRVISPAVGIHMNTHPTALTPLQQADPLTDPAAASTALPNHQHLRAKPILRQIRDQPIETIPGLPRVPRRTCRRISIRRLIQRPTLLRSQALVIGVLLIQRPSPTRTIQRYPQVVPGPYRVFPLVSDDSCRHGQRVQLVRSLHPERGGGGGGLVRRGAGGVRPGLGRSGDTRTARVHPRASTAVPTPHPVRPGNRSGRAPDL